MENSKELLYLLYSQLGQAEAKLSDVKSLIKKIEEEVTYTNIFIKTISGKKYYYAQWYEQGKLKNKSLGPVVPGRISSIEKKVEELKNAKEREEELECLIDNLNTYIERMQKTARKGKVLEEYEFEVYWKNDISARVYVHEDHIRVSRFIKHPAKQLFAKDKMTRNQLNEIMAGRCWDQNRPDLLDLLKGIGLESFNPKEILRKTHGVMRNDFIWFRFPGENIQAEDVLLRPI